MAPETTPPLPGGLTVPLFFGGEVLVTVVVILVVVGVAWLVLGLARAGTSEQAEWQAWLESRSGRRAASVEASGGPSGGGPAADPAVSGLVHLHGARHERPRRPGT
jgi:hypothetical protein